VGCEAVGRLPHNHLTTFLPALERSLSGKVVKTTLAGAIVDIGLETPGVVHISQLTKEPVNRVEDVVQVGQEVDVWVRRVQPQKGRLELTMIKPLDLEWREIKKDMVVKGKVIRLEKFGVFVEIGAERPGLVHVSELTHDYIHSPSEVVKEGDEVEVMVLGVNRQKKQIKLSMKALEEKPVKEVKVVQEKSKGSRHDWLEGRGPWLSLLAYIDDATGEVPWAGFREEEDAAGYFLGLRAICLTQGIPGAIYADQHTIFQSPAEATLEQELNGEQPRSQLGGCWTS
jgi:predicted RNA-binding protein with RPS1 domain